MATLDELEAMEKAATAGPWLPDDHLVTREGNDGEVDTLAECERAYGDRGLAIKNARLVAAARNALPLLIEIARAARDWDKDEEGGCMYLDVADNGDADRWRAVGCVKCPGCRIRSALARLTGGGK